MFEKRVLPNGLRVISSPMPQVKSVAALVLVEAGSRYEQKENNGVSHFLEHMMFKGTTKRPSKVEIAGILDRIGASFNAFTSKEYTGFYVKSAAEHRKLILDMLSDIVLHSTYPAEEVEKDRDVIIEEINMDEDEPANKAARMFEATMFSGSTLGWQIAGEKETVAKISRNQIISYVNKMYHSRSMLVALSGQLGDGDEAASEVAKYFGNVATGAENRFVPDKDLQTRPQTKVHFKKTEQAHFILGFRGVSITDPRKYALSILANILGGNMSSRLFQEVREKRGLAYYVGASSDEYLDTGLLAASAGVNLDKAEEAIKVILDEFAKLMEDKVSDDELRRAKDYSKGKMVLMLEDSFRVASFFGSQELLEKKVLLPDEVLENLEKVTAEDVQSVARDLLKARTLNLALVGPFKDEGKFSKILKI